MSTVLKHNDINAIKIIHKQSIVLGIFEGVSIVHFSWSALVQEKRKCMVFIVTSDLQPTKISTLKYYQLYGTTHLNNTFLHNRVRNSIHQRRNSTNVFPSHTLKGENPNLLEQMTFLKILSCLCTPS